MSLRIMISVTLLVAASQGYADSYTHYQAEDGTVTVQRSKEVYSAEPGVVSSCIALPVSWNDDLKVTIAGAAGATDFSARLSSDTVSAAVMNSNWSYPGFNWSCFSDTARNYEDGGQVVVSFTFKPGVADMRTFTMTGLNMGEYFATRYPQAVEMHRLVVNENVTDNLMLLSGALD